MKIKVMLVDDHRVVLQGLHYFLQTQSDIDIVGQAQDGKEAVEQIGYWNPDVVLMDIQMPRMDGIEATKRIKKDYPAVKVIMLTSYSDQDSILAAIQAGAMGYQLKDISPDILVETIRAAMNDTRMFHPQVTNQLVSHVSHEANMTTKYILTPREREVLYHITLGKTNKEIAFDLHITEKTVKTHITNLLNKMEVQDRTQAALHAIKNNWCE